MANPPDERDRNEPARNPFDRFDRSGKLPSDRHREFQESVEQAARAVQGGGQWLRTRAINGATGLMDTAVQAHHTNAPVYPLLQLAARSAGLPKMSWEDWLFHPGALTRDTIYASGVPEVNLPGPWGKVADAGVESLMSGFVLPGGLSLPVMISNLAAGAGSELAGQATLGTPWEAPARLFVGLGAGYGAGALAARPPLHARMTMKRVGELTPAQWRDLQNLQSTSVRQNVPLQLHEVMPGGRSEPLAQYVADAGSLPGGTGLGRAARDRIPGARAAIARHMDEIAPSVTNPAAVDIRLAEAAAAAVRAAKRPVTVDEAIPRQLTAVIDDALAKVDPDGVAAAQLRELRAMVMHPGDKRMPPRIDPNIAVFRLPDNTKWQMMQDRYPSAPPVYETNAARLDPVFARLDDLTRPRAADPTPRVTEAAHRELQPILDHLRPRISRAHADYRKSVEADTFAGGRSGGDIEHTGVGRIARAYDGNPDQAVGLFGRSILDPQVARPATVRADMERLMRHDPDAARAAVRKYIEEYVERAFGREHGEPSPTAGVRFSKEVASGDIQRGNLIAAVEVVTGNATTAQGVAKLLDILARTDMTPPPSSGARALVAEAFDSSLVGKGLDVADAAKGGVAGVGPKWVDGVLRNGLGLARKWYQEVWGPRFVEQVIDLATHPESVRKLHELALLNPRSARSKALAASLVQGAVSADKTEP